MKQSDVEMYRRFQVDPLFFVEKVWGLVPQPIKNEYKEEWEDENCDLEKVRVYWFRKFEKGKNITWQQAIFLRMVQRAVTKKGSWKIAVASGRGTGKSSTCAIIVLWYLFCHKDAQVGCTAPTTQQMHDVLWKEIQIWMNRMPQKLAANFQWSTSYVRIAESPSTWFARAITARKENPDSLAGLHGDFVCCLVDESCHDDSTEILTRRGWRLFEDLKKDEEVLSMNSQQEAKWEKIERRIMMPYKGKMYVPTVTRCLDFCITPNHDLYLKGNRGKFRKIKPKDLSRMDYTGTCTINYQALQKDVFIVPRCNYLRNKSAQKDWQFKMKDWLEFLGWYFSEGNLPKRKSIKGKIRYNSVVISQKNKGYRVKIEELLDRMGVSYSVNEKGFSVFDTQIAMYLSKWGVGFDKKRVPDFIRELPPHQIDVFLKAFRDGDGYMKNKIMVLYTSNEGLANDLHELCCLAGYRTTIKKRNLKGQIQWIIDHWATSTRDGYVINASPPSGFTIKPRAPLEAVDYDGMVYCVTTPSGLIYTRKNGYCMWSGNSGVPDQVFDIGEGSFTGENNLMIMVSNYRRLTGHFHRAFTKERHLYQVGQFDSSQSPIVKEDFLATMLLKGKDSDEYRVEVAGLPPKAETIDDKGFVPLLTEKDLRFTYQDQFVGTLFMGVDPAGEGRNETVWVIRDHYKAKVVAREQISNEKTIASKTILLAAQYGIKQDHVYVDGFGVGDKTVRELYINRFYAISVNTGVEPDDKEKFLNKKAELAWRLREWMRSGGEMYGSLNEWDNILNVKYTIAEGGNYGKIKMMSKRQMKDANIDSPDAYEALCLTFDARIDDVPEDLDDDEEDMQDAFYPI